VPSLIRALNLAFSTVVSFQGEELCSEHATSPLSRMAMFQAQDAMTEKVIMASPDATIDQAIQLLLDHQISGAPVVDDNGCLVGIVSEYRLLEVAYDPALNDRRVRDIMTKTLITVAPSTWLPEVVTLFVMHRIRRLPVVQNGRLLGIIARRDVLRYVAENRASVGTLFNELNDWRRNFTSHGDELAFVG
jgi:CBS domain-containing protein